VLEEAVAFDAGRSFEPDPAPPRDVRTAEDVLDLVLRVLVLLPLLALYTWWIASTVWLGLKALIGL
jgi:hypothetical protein